MVEMMVVVACMMLLLIPAWKVFHHGTKSSLQGMLQIETTMEARRILKQLNQDLKHSCWEWNDTNAFYSLQDILSTSGSFPNTSYSFAVFPFSGDISGVVPTGSNYDPGPQPRLARRVSRVIYRLAPSPKIARDGYPSNFPMYRLLREETLHPGNPQIGQFPGGVRVQELSERVLMFDILPYISRDAGGNEQQFFWVTLQLVDTVNRSGVVQVITDSTSNRLTQRSRDLVIADFFDVVSPKFFAAYRQTAGPRLGIKSTYDRSSYFDPAGP